MVSKLMRTAAVCALLASPVLVAAPFAATAASPQAVVETQQKGEWLSSNFIGETVKNEKDEAIGDINDLVFKSDGKIHAAVIGVGGFLGIGEKDVAVTFDSLTIKPGKNGQPTIMVKMTKEQLEGAKEFKRLDESRGGVTQKLKQSYEGAKSGAKKAYEDAKSGAKKAYEDAKAGAKKAWEGTKDAAEDVKDKSEDAVDKAEDKVDAAK